MMPARGQVQEKRPRHSSCSESFVCFKVHLVLFRIHVLRFRYWVLHATFGWVTDRSPVASGTGVTLESPNDTDAL
jgi:hypothetical protein